jgi:hypothetical protein
MPTNCPRIAHKNPRGLVSISNEKSRIRLRWSYQGKRYSINFLEDKIKSADKDKKCLLERVLTNSFSRFF